MRLRFVHWLMFFLAIILGLASLSFYYYAKNNLVEGQEIRLTDAADRIIVEIAKDLHKFKRQPDTFLFSATENEFTASGILVQFMDNRGVLLSRSPSLKKNILPFVATEDDLLRDIELTDRTELKVYQRKIEFEDNELGYVIVGLSTVQLNRTLLVVRNVLIVGMFVTLIILWFGVNALASINQINAQRQFLSFVSHEVRTPLSVIAGTAEVALRQTLPPAEYAEALKTIKDESEWLNKLVANFLTIARGEAGVEKMNKVTFNLGELIAEAAGEIKKLYPGKIITLNLTPEAQIRADQDRLKQVVNNLLENAAKNTQPGGQIKVSLESRGGKMVIKVKDDGVGIEKDRQKKIFNAFYRLEQNKNEGIGLGLAICQWIVGAHGGKIEVESEPGHGAVFTVSLPINLK